MIKKKVQKKKVTKQRDNLIIRAKEVCQMLGIGKNTLYEWCKQGLIPHKRIGKLIFFSQRVIQELIENKAKEVNNARTHSREER